MDCLFWAYSEHILDLGLRPKPSDYSYYRMLKVYTHGFTPQSTFGGIAPWMVGRLARRHGLSVRMNSVIFRYSHYSAMLEDIIRDLSPVQAMFWGRQRSILLHTHFDIWRRVINLHPAIYLLLDSQHAVYSETVPAHGTPIMALQLYDGG